MMVSISNQKEQASAATVARYRIAAVVIALGAIAVLVGGLAVFDAGPVSPAQAQSGATEISNWTDLDNIRNDLTGEYVFVNNLDRTTEGYEQVAGPNANGGSGFIPIGGFAARFTGSLDGQGHVISDIVIDQSNSPQVGLFSVTDPAGSIANISLTNVTIDGTKFVGGIIGQNVGGTVTNSTVDGAVNGSENVGGLVGLNRDNGNIIDSRTDASVTGSEEVGGLVGVNRKGTVSRSFAVGTVTGNMRVGGLIGILGQSLDSGDESVLADSYFNNHTAGQDAAVGSIENVGDGTAELRGDVTGLNTSQMQGQSAEANMSGLDFEDTWMTVTNPDDYPMLQAQAQQSGPIKISDWTDLDNIRNDPAGDYILINNLNKSTDGYEQVASPSANGGDGFLPIGGPGGLIGAASFNGTFDGQGHEIRDVVINRATDIEVGLFGVSDTNGTILNVSVKNITVNGELDVGALIGQNSGNVTNVQASGKINGSDNIGGLIGINTGNVTDSIASGIINGSNFVGGLVGVNAGSVTDSISSGSVTGREYVGGLVGTTGGLESGNITDSQASGTVSGIEYVGGLVGANGDSKTGISGSVIKQSTASGAVTTNQSSKTEAIGGLVGESFQGTIIDSHATGNVTAPGATDVGGLVGYTGVLNPNPTFQTEVKNSSATGEVKGDENVGGLVGRMNNDTVADSYARGNVTGLINVGGLVGFNNGMAPSGLYFGLTTVRESYATGDVAGGQNTGGLIGINRNDTVINTYALGNVSGVTNTGGLVGVNNGTNAEINSSYAVGDISGGDDSSTGGLVGSNQNGATVINSYWDIEATGQTDSDASATGLTTEQMQGVTPTNQGQNTMFGFNFTRDGGNTWVAVVEGGQINPTPERDGYPILQNLTAGPQLDGQSPTSPLAQYANEQGVIKISGITDAISDWQNGEIGIGLVSDVITAWQSGDVVG